MTKVIEHNASTGEIIEREMTTEELNNLEADKIRAEERKEAQKKALIDRAALLERLGITEQEAKLLLG